MRMTSRRLLNWGWAVAAMALLLCGQKAFAETPPFRWARAAGGVGTDYGTGLALDSAGNTFVLGKFGSQLAQLGSLVVSNAEYFLAKYDPDGTPVWVRPIGFPAYQANLPLNYRLGCDAAGSVYIGGSFTAGPLSFGDVTLTNLSSTYFSLFLAKYDEAGNLAWATNASGHHPDTRIRGPAFAVAADGSCYLAGNYMSAPDLGLPEALGNGFLGIYVAKFTTSGGQAWARGYLENPPTSFYHNTPIAMALRTDGGFYLYGHFVLPTFALAGVTLTNRNPNPPSSDIFVGRFDPEGDLLWARSGGSLGEDYANTLGVDATGAIQVCGRYAGGNPADYFSFDQLAFTNTGDFMVKYHADGTAEWGQGAAHFEPSWGGAFMRFAVDQAGNSFAFGWFSSTAQFGELTLTNSQFSSSFFLAKRNAGGAVLWAKQFCHGNTGLAYDWVRETEEGELAINAAGDLVLTADFTAGNPVFDDFTLTSYGQEDVFVARVDAGRPRLELFRAGDAVVLVWPSDVPFQLETTTTLAAPGSWQLVTNTVSTAGPWSRLTNSLPPGEHYFRLRKP